MWWLFFFLKYWFRLFWLKVLIKSIYIYNNILVMKIVTKTCNFFQVLQILIFLETLAVLNGWETLKLFYCIICLLLQPPLFALSTNLLQKSGGNCMLGLLKITCFWLTAFHLWTNQIICYIHESQKYFMNQIA